MKTKWITEAWGVIRMKPNHWMVIYGEPDRYVYTHLGSGYRSLRRAKKEITHYIERGLPKGPFSGAYAHMVIIAIM